MRDKSNGREQARGLDKAQLRQMQWSRASSRKSFSHEHAEAYLFYYLVFTCSLILLTHDHTSAYPSDCLSLTYDTCEHARNTVCAYFIFCARTDWTESSACPPTHAASIR